MDPAAAAAVPLARGEGGERAGGGAGGRAAAPGPPRSAPPRAGAAIVRGGAGRLLPRPPPPGARAPRAAPPRSPERSPAPIPGRPGEGKAAGAARRFPLPAGDSGESSVPHGPQRARCARSRRGTVPSSFVSLRTWCPAAAEGCCPAR
ncbi:unnamed protein product [Coccothraustes coccothraustes]